MLNKDLVWLMDMILMVSETLFFFTVDKWRKHRKILTPTFHFKILEDFMPVFNSNGVILTLVLQKKLGRDVNVMEHMSRLSLDIICGNV